MENNITKEMLEKQLAEVDTQLTDLGNKRAKIIDDMKSLAENEYRLTNEILNVSDNSVIVSIANHPDYHYVIIAMYLIVSNYDDTRFEVYKYSYRMDDYDYSFSAEEVTIGKHTFNNLKDTCSLYNVNTDVFNEILNKCVQLQITEGNINEIRTLCRQNCNGRIEILKR